MGGGGNVEARLGALRPGALTRCFLALADEVSDLPRRTFVPT
jgi:hypothetical protein